MDHRLSICAIFLSIYVTFISAETYYVVPSSSTTCPEGGVACFTLSQYATKPVDYFNTSNTTLVLLPGNHILNSELFINNITSLSFKAPFSLSPPVSTVACSESARFRFEFIGQVSVSSVSFSGCVDNTVTSVEQFTVEDCTLNGQGRNGTALDLNRVTSGNILRSSFFSNTGKDVIDSFRPWIIVKGGGAVKITHSNVSITSSTLVGNTADLGGAIFSEYSSLDIENCTFESNSAASDGGGVTAAYSSVTINGSTFFNHTAASFGGAIVIWVNASSVIDNCVFLNNSVGLGGGAVDLFDSPHTNYMSNCEFIYNSASAGSVIIVEATTLVTSGYISIHDNQHGTIFAFSSKLTFFGQTSIVNNTYTNSSQLQQDGGAITCFRSEISFFDNAELNHNKAEQGGAISATESKLYFRGNVSISHNIANSTGGGIYSYRSGLSFWGNADITGNVGSQKGGGIHAVDTSVSLMSGSLRFVANDARKGGGMCLELNAKLYVVKDRTECEVGPRCSLRDRDDWLKLEFTNNSADYGGALFVSDETNSGTCDAIPFSANSFTTGECFFQALALHPLYEEDLNVRNTYFTNNTARSAQGHTLYGGLLDRCTVSPFAEIFRVAKYRKLSPGSLDALSYFLNLTNVSRSRLQFEISSDPVRVCFCHDDQPDCSYQPPALLVRKGETFNVSLVAVDQVNNTLPNTNIHNTVSSKDGFGDGCSTKNTSNGCTNLAYNIFSLHHAEKLFLTASGPCQDSPVSKRSLSVEFKPCPIGFRDSETECECDPVLHPTFVTNCSIDSESVRRRETVWISLLNRTDQQGYMIYSNCPFDYCHPSTKDVQINLNTHNGADAQCAFNRSGKLCGSCEDLVRMVSVSLLAVHSVRHVQTTGSLSSLCLL